MLLQTRIGCAIARVLTSLTSNERCGMRRHQSARVGAFLSENREPRPCRTRQGLFRWLGSRQINNCSASIFPSVHTAPRRPGVGDVGDHEIGLLQHPVVAPGDCVARVDGLDALWEHGVRIVVVLGLLTGHVGQPHSVIDSWVLLLQIPQNPPYNGIKPPPGCQHRTCPHHDW